MWCSCWMNEWMMFLLTCDKKLTKSQLSPTHASTKRKKKKECCHFRDWKMHAVWSPEHNASLYSIYPLFTSPLSRFGSQPRSVLANNLWSKRYSSKLRNLLALCWMPIGAFWRPGCFSSSKKFKKKRLMTHMHDDDFCCWVFFPVFNSLLPHTTIYTAI